MLMAKKLCVVVPVYNEAGGIRHFYDALKTELDAIAGYDCSILFVDDGSEDDSYSILRSIAMEDGVVRLVRLSRNFGHQAALLAGMDAAEGDVVVTMDADMQHPPAVIARLLAEFEQGSDVVYTFREDSDDVGLLRKKAGSLFYSLVNLVSDVHIHRNASDFRLISARVLALIKTKIRERNMFLRGIVSWVGFRQSSVKFKADPRYAGKSKYTIARNIQFAMFGLISFSKKPLRAATFVGMLAAIAGFLFAAYTVLQYYQGHTVEGWATVVVLLSIFGGIQLFFLGVIGEYIGAIFDEVKGRPQYIVSESVNI